ncbi:RluA family pseudouridine synthase [candidate division TA06 bacterium]|uniref:Pseudouridine synthase n=1 Tax=candidate division TA06 bacterium TaxID=2250710 RepID=A0A933IA58_UNCT6|nr:RluA family pseudouridine synthase [candidate division TA06 bacterium]
MPDELQIINVTVSSAQSRVRLDRYLSCQGMNHSRNQLQKFIESGRVLVDGKLKTPGYLVKPGDRIEIKKDRLAAPRRELLAEDIALDVVYEDQDLLVINKPAGMVVHPAAGNRRGTMVNALLHHAQNLSRVGGRERPGILHRLDKGTSGLLLAAKTDQVHTLLARQLEARKIVRRYRAVVWGILGEPEGTISAPIGRSAFDRKKMGVTSLRGRQAVTHYRVLREYKIASLVEIKLETGRTHQIRVHLQHLGHPVLGDPDYGGRARSLFSRFASANAGLAQELLDAIGRQALHAAALGFVHPATSKYMEFKAPLPGDMEEVIRLLEKGAYRELRLDLKEMDV